MRLNSVSVKQRADGTRLMTICRTATVPPTRSVVLAHIIVIPSRAPDTHTHARTRIRTRAAGHLIFHRWVVFARKVWYPVISRCLSLLHARSSLWRPFLPSFFPACLLRLGLFFSSFFWNLRWTPRDRFAGLLLWWGFKLEIICRGTRGNVARVVSVELNVPRVSLSVVERSCRNFERNL